MFDGQLLGDRFCQRQELLRTHQIRFVQNQPDATLLLSQRLNDGLSLFSQTSLGIDEQKRDISILRSCPGSCNHSPVELTTRLEYTRRIDEQNLGRLTHEDAEHTKPRRLGLWADNRKLRPGHSIDQGGFSGIRSPNQGYETTTCRHLFSFAPLRLRFNLWRSAVAASLSAWRLLPATPSPASPIAETATVKRGAWEGPSIDKVS